MDAGGTGSWGACPASFPPSIRRPLAKSVISKCETTVGGTSFEEEAGDSSLSADGAAIPTLVKEGGLAFLAE